MDRIVVSLLRVRIPAPAKFRVRKTSTVDGFRQYDIDRLLKYLPISLQFGGVVLQARMTLRLPQPVLIGFTVYRMIG